MRKPKLIPILFSTEMVRAILNDRKITTRRTIKFKTNPSPTHLALISLTDDIATFKFRASSVFKFDVKCPYGIKGDILYVRETFYAYGYWISERNENKGGIKKSFMDCTMDLMEGKYRYFENPPESIMRGMSEKKGWYRRPAIFMPKDACRIFLERTDTDATRLQQMNDLAALAEGVQGLDQQWLNLHFPEYAGLYAHWEKVKDFPLDHGRMLRPPLGPSPLSRFKALWNSINGFDSWDNNPWVWVVGFTRIGEPIFTDTIKKTAVIEYVACSDCGKSFDKSTMQWGHNSWNKNKGTSAEYAYVCQNCWDNRGMAAMGC